MSEDTTNPTENKEKDTTASDVQEKKVKVYDRRAPFKGQDLVLLQRRLRELNESEYYLTLSERLERTYLKKEFRRRNKQKDYFTNMFKNYRTKQKDKLDQAKNKISRFVGIIGKADFVVLKDICTMRTPEKKDEDGKVTEEAKSNINYGALLNECRHLIVILREQRIVQGKRKRSTGRSSRRKHHAGMVRFLNRRNSEARKEELKPAPTR